MGDDWQVKYSCFITISYCPDRYHFNIDKVGQVRSQRMHIWLVIGWLLGLLYNPIYSEPSDHEHLCIMASVPI